MARIDTLTAYSCKFSYLQRNNPLIEEQREAIKKGEQPDFGLSDFLELYAEYAKNLAIGENTDRAIMMVKDQIVPFPYEGSNCWHIIPSAGKQGRPVTVIKTSNGKRYDFGADSAALYDHHVFCYSDGEHIVMIFHRQNGSGCKSVFLETANKLLKEKGIKFEMDVVVPFEDELGAAEALKITLQYTDSRLSSDVAENISGPKRKKKVIRDLGLNLESSENSRIKCHLDEFRLGHISKDVAFARIKAEIHDDTEYDSAEVRLKIGNHTKNYPWSEIENLYGNHDISDELHTLYKSTGNFKEALRHFANEYYDQIISSGVLENE